MAAAILADMPSAAELLAARARRVTAIRQRVIAAVAASFVLFWGVVAWDGAMGAEPTTTTAAQPTTTSGSTTSDSASSDSSTTTEDQTWSDDTTSAVPGDNGSSLQTSQS